MKTIYSILDAEDREVNFYDKQFPDALRGAISSASKVAGSCIVEKTFSDTGELSEKVIWENPRKEED